MKKSKITALLLAGTLAVTSFLPSVTASAAPTYCQKLVGVNQCGQLVRGYRAGQSITYEDSHKYGGFLGIGAKQCTYRYYYEYMEYRCLAGHVAETTSTRREYGHTCGQ